MFLLAYGLANGRPNKEAKQYSASRALIGLCIKTVQLHSTTLTLTKDTIKLKDAVAATVPWKTFTSILNFYALLLEL